jgi:hypothetical protein
MKLNKRKILIIAGSTVAVAGVTYFIYTRFRNKKEINEIHAILDSGTGRFGSVEDFSDVFSGTTYVNDMKLAHQNLILLKNDFVEMYRKALYNAIQYWGTDENAVKDVFRKLKDRVHIAQVAASYQINYGENLLDALKGEMDEDSEEMKEIFETMKNKPAYRIAK